MALMVDAVRKILHRYGLLTIDPAHVVQRDDGWCEATLLRARASDPHVVLVFRGADEVLGSRVLLYAPQRWWRPRRLAYHALLGCCAIEARDLRPLWVDADNRPVAAWRQANGRHELWVGLNIAEEVVRHTQGDPARVAEVQDKSRFGFDFERPNYLYDQHVVPQQETTAWADALGFMVAEQLGRRAGHPLVHPLPGAARGLMLLTGDDDQADLSRYQQQLALIGDTPITYYLHPLTHHTPETLAAMPATVDFGIHVDALDAPRQYAAASREQCAQLRALCRRPARTVRNHGFLNDGYLGHLPAWEADGLRLDVNVPGVDGTALNGSFLPYEVRRPDGTWSSHYGLLTAFGDGMVYVLKMSAGEAARRIRALAVQVEGTFPGVLTCNMHPQNIIDTTELHHAIVSVTKRKGWRAVTAEQLLDWLDGFAQLVVRVHDNRLELVSECRMENVAVRYARPWGWSAVRLPAWIGACAV